MKPITVPTLSRWENSLNSPTDDMWRQLADYFNVSVSYIKGEIDEEYLENLIELAILFIFPEMILTYGEIELDDEVIEDKETLEILKQFNKYRRKG